ncbi:MAG: hypothetical protein IJE59_01705 [Clostridia bacterium]|nr:hypothetical protein [Clostridia bacterium]
MPRNFNKYQYETSPRKLEPEYTPIKNPYKTKKTTARKIDTGSKKKSLKEIQIKKQKNRAIRYLIVGFLILFGISFRNSQIDENFAKIQDLKQELADVEKQNAQLEISIENGLNLNNLEQEAKEQLGMQKLNSKQTTYITLPKTDYIEPAAEQVIIEEQGGIKGIINEIGNIFK